MAYKLPNLPYPYDALERAIDATTMEIHHDLHHATYLKNLNDALELVPEFANLTIEDVLTNIDQISQPSQLKIKNNAGGFYHHTLFFDMMSPQEQEPTEVVVQALTKDFGGVDQFKEKFSEKALGQFGSGWVWLVKIGAKLEIISTPNQDSPLSMRLTPLLGIDVWEHAYYLRYQNRRAEYIENWWKVVNWKYVEEKLNHEN